jgi:hypothetical protein
MDGNKIINLSYDIEYYNYRTFVIKQISTQYNIIFNIFDESLIENLVKLYILFKKNKLNQEFNTYIELIFELIFSLKNINKLLTTDFLDIVLYILRINMIIPTLVELLDKTTYNKLINLELIKIKFSNLVEDLSKNNLLIYNLDKLSKNINDSDNIKELLEFTIKILACDYFMNYNSSDILKLINDKLKILKNNFLLMNILKYKKKFISEYDNLYIKYNDLYFDINIMVNKDYKYEITNKFFLEMITDINNVTNNIK